MNGLKKRRIIEMEDKVLQGIRNKVILQKLKNISKI